jgi:hypothetical protein
MPSGKAIAIMRRIPETNDDHPKRSCLSVAQTTKFLQSSTADIRQNHHDGYSRRSKANCRRLPGPQVRTQDSPRLLGICKFAA